MQVTMTRTTFGSPMPPKPWHCSSGTPRHSTGRCAGRPGTIGPSGPAGTGGSPFGMVGVRPHPARPTATATTTAVNRCRAGRSMPDGTRVRSASRLQAGARTVAVLYRLLVDDDCATGTRHRESHVAGVETLQPHHNPTAYLPRRGGVVCTRGESERAPTSFRPAAIDSKIRPLFDAPSIDSRATANSSRLLAWRSTRPMRPEVSPSSTRQPRNSGDAGPRSARNGAGRGSSSGPTARPMAHDECPMAIAIEEGRSVRGYEVCGRTA